MSVVFRLLRYAWFTGWYVLALSILLAAVLLSLVRLALPSIAENYNAEVEALLGEVLQRPITIGGIDADWQGLGPRLILRDVVLLDPDDKSVSLALESASLGFSPFALFASHRYGLSTISLSGFNLILRRDRHGTIDISGLAEAAPDSVSAENVGSGAGREITGWLLAHGHVEVANANVYWIDQVHEDRVWQFADVNVALQNRRGSYRLRGRALLPGELGRQVAFVLDLDGEATRPETWSGKTWLKLEDLNYGMIRQALAIGDTPVADGRLSAEVWGEWNRGQPRRLLGNFSATDLHLSAPGRDQLVIDSVSSRFRWRRSAELMELDLARMEARWQQQLWRDVNMGLLWRQAAAGSRSPQPDQVPAEALSGMRLTRLHSSYLDVRGALSLLDYFEQLPEQSRPWLQATQPAGVIRNLILERPANPNDDNITLSAEFRALSARPWKDVPGVSGISGDIRTDLQYAAINLKSRGVRLEYPAHMARPLSAEQVEGTVWVHRNQDYIQINTSELLLRTRQSSGHIAVGVYWPEQRPRPWLEIYAGMREGQLAGVLDNVPVTTLGMPLREWWNRAVRKGRISNAHFAHAGWTNEYPYTSGNGQIALTGTVDRVELAYLKDWPVLKSAEARVTMADGGLVVDVSTGEILNTPVQGGRVDIAGLYSKDPQVRVRGTFIGRTSDKLQYVLTAPPLRRLFAAGENFTVRGNSRLDLDVKMPILQPEAVTVNGTLAINDNSLSHRGGLGRIASSVTTVAVFDEQSLSAGEGAGLLFGQPVRLGVSTHAERQGQRSIQVTAKGNYRLRPLLQRFGVENWSHLAQGEDKFLAVLQIPLGSDGKRYPELNLSASARALESLLPPPLNKKPGEDRTMNLRLVFKPDVHEWYVDDGQRLRAALAMLPLEEAYTLSHGEVLVGAGRPDLAWSDGLRLRADLDKLSFDDWTRAISGTRAESRPLRETGWDVLPDWVKRVELNSDSMRLFDRDYSQVRIRADRHQAGLLVAVNSREFIGDINIPQSPALPINMRLQYWNLLSTGDENPVYGKPTDLPAMNIECDDFRYQNGALGRLSSVVSQTDDGIRIQKLEIHSAHTNMVGLLDWSWRDGSHYSSLDLSIESENVGKTMSRLGYAGTVQGGKGTLTMKASWPEPPPEILSEQLNGEIHMKLNNGSLLEISPGAGRALAIFSLQMLPQRLLLDFSDLFSAGFRFKSVTGDFSIQEGEAYTTNLIMEGPSSKILIAGRTGLAQRDYDQLVTVIPEVTASIPVLAWWLVDLPAGVMALALQKLFQSEIDDVVKFQYIISGTWSEPVITKVEPEPQPEPQPQSPLPPLDDVP